MKEIDELSGTETTGHEWDGLKELNSPLPRWWVWIFLITVIWAVWYMVIYPAWPTLSGATKGTSGYTQYKELKENQAEIIKRQNNYLQRFEKASFKEIMRDPELYAFAVAGGASAFKDNCATCHGTGGEGATGYPNLNDDDWLWGGTLTEIYKTLQYGIRADNLDTHLSQMPAFGKDGLLNKKELMAVTNYVLAISGGKVEKDFSTGSKVFKNQCASCHGPDGEGMQEFGAPNLTDKIWLKGGDKQSIYNSIFYAKSGMMPAWIDRLDDNTLRQLTVYLHHLGGGEEEYNHESAKQRR
jgi:cytochrome c oxidase cbb3-type subunit 3